MSYPDDELDLIWTLLVLTAAACVVALVLWVVLG